MTVLLEIAADQAGGRTPHSNRVASWFIRAALEEIIKDLLLARNIDAGHASTAACLSCLEVAYRDSPEVAARAQYAWCRLSQACHQHAYELSPTSSEVEHLMGIVAGLAHLLASGVGRSGAMEGVEGDGEGDRCGQSQGGALNFVWHIP